MEKAHDHTLHTPCFIVGIDRLRWCHLGGWWGEVYSPGWQGRSRTGCVGGDRHGVSGIEKPIDNPLRVPARPRHPAVKCPFSWCRVTRAKPHLPFMPSSAIPIRWPSGSISMSIVSISISVSASAFQARATASARAAAMSLQRLIPGWSGTFRSAVDRPATWSIDQPTRQSGAGISAPCPFQGRWCIDVCLPDALGGEPPDSGAGLRAAQPRGCGAFSAGMDVAQPGHVCTCRCAKERPAMEFEDIACPQAASVANATPGRARAQPLSGIRVLDFSSLVPGPLCTLLLAEAGAEVTKIERPQAGDEMRGYAPKAGEDSANFVLLNRGKKSIAIELKTRAQELHALIGESDLLIEQFRPGVMARRGLDYESVRAINPRIIHCAIPGYGQSGPRAIEGGQDLNYLASTGLLGLWRQPALPPPLIADIAGGAHPARLHILLALRQRDQTGQGCMLDV